MTAPSKFAHVVYKTHRFDELIDWYCRVLDARVQNRTDKLAFLTYDDEHHRIALFNLGPAADGQAVAPDKPSMFSQQVGVHHVAYTWPTLDGLLEQYERMKALGVRPQFTVRHGPTLSFYYADPDGNCMEFQVDVLHADDATAFMNGDAFHANPIGEPFDPEELLVAHRAGTPLRELVLRSDQVVPEGGLSV